MVLTDLRITKICHILYIKNEAMLWRDNLFGREEFGSINQVARPLIATQVLFRTSSSDDVGTFQINTFHACW